MVQRYKDEKIIAAWTLVNEAEARPDPNNGACSDASAQALHDFAKDNDERPSSRADPNHLVTLGTLGANQCGLPGEHVDSSGKRQGNFAWIHDDTGLDFCDMHIYDQTASYLAQRAKECIT